jgi:hypothetical protein
LDECGKLREYFLTKGVRKWGSRELWEAVLSPEAQHRSIANISLYLTQFSMEFHEPLYESVVNFNANLILYTKETRNYTVSLGPGLSVDVLFLALFALYPGYNKSRKC